MNERSIFLEALEITPPAERAAFLDRVCDGNADLRKGVEGLLAVNDRSGTFMRPPAGGDMTADFRLSEGPGSRVGPYKLLQEIGEGGMGVVYMAEQEVPVRRKLALKIIKPGMDTKQVVARFEAERQALGMMDHPNIAKVFDAGSTNSGRPYFVMELVHGVPITEYCDANKLNPRERLELFVPVRQAIQHAHMKGIIHRDVKPSNVLVTMYDDKPVPKVIDFGVAKAVEQRLTEKTLFTQYGALVGTFEYMSPEQAELNAFGVDTRSDVYSLGVLLYELLTGTTPLERQRLRTAAFGEVVRLIKEEEPPRPSLRISTSGTLAKVAAARKTEPAKLSGLVRGELDWIVMRCLEKDRSRRYDGAATLAKDVQRYLTGDAVEACPPTLGYRLTKAYRRNKAAVLVATAFTLLMTAAVAVSSLLAFQASQAEREAKANAFAANSERDEKAKALLAESEAKQSEATARERLRQTLYAAEMNLIQVSYKSDDFLRVRQLLDRQRPTRGEPDLRGFEWHYWDRQMNREVKSVQLPFKLDSIALDSGRQRTVVSKGTLSPDGRWVAVIAGNLNESPSFIVLDADTGREVLHEKMPAIPPAGTSQPTPTLGFTGNGEYLVCRWPQPGQDDLKKSIREWTQQLTIRRVSDGKIMFERTGAYTFTTCHSGIAIWPALPSFAEPKKEYPPVTIEIWDATKGVSPKVTLPVTKGNVQVVRSLSGDGTRVAVSEMPVGFQFATAMWSSSLSVVVFDTSTGVEKVRLTDLPTMFSGIVLSPDGTKLAVGSNMRATGDANSQPKLGVWDVASGKQLFQVESLSRVNATLSFSPDGKRLLWYSNGSAEGGNPVSVRDAATGQVVAEHHSLSGMNLAAAFTADGSHVRTLGRDGVAKLWAIPPTAQPVALPAPAGPDSSYIPPAIRNRPITYTADRELKRFLTVEMDGQKWSPRVVDVDNRLILKLSEFDGSPASVAAAFSPDGSKLALMLTGVSFGPRGPVEQMSPAIKMIGLEVWDLVAGRRVLQTPMNDLLAITEFAFTRDGQHIIHRTFDGQGLVLRLLDPITGEEQFRVPVAETQDPNRTGFAGWDGREPHSYDPTTKRLLIPCPTSEKDPQPTVRQRHVESGEDVVLYTGPAGLVVSEAAYSPDGKRVAIGLGRKRLTGKDAPSTVPCRVLMVEASNGRVVWEREMPDFNSARFCFSSDGRRFAVGHQNAKSGFRPMERIFHLSVCDAETGGNWVPILADAPTTSGFDINRDGTRIVAGLKSGLTRGEIRLLDTTTGRELLSLPESGRGSAVKFSPDGQRIYAMGQSVSLRKTPADVYDATPLPMQKK